MGNNQNLSNKSRIIKKKLKIGPILKVLTLKFSRLLKRIKFTRFCSFGGFYVSLLFGFFYK